MILPLTICTLLSLCFNIFFIAAWFRSVQELHFLENATKEEVNMLNTISENRLNEVRRLSDDLHKCRIDLKYFKEGRDFEE